MQTHTPHVHAHTRKDFSWGIRSWSLPLALTSPSSCHPAGPEPFPTLVFSLQNTKPTICSHPQCPVSLGCVLSHTLNTLCPSLPLLLCSKSTCTQTEDHAYELHSCFRSQSLPGCSPQCIYHMHIHPATGTCTHTDTQAQEKNSTPHWRASREG